MHVRQAPPAQAGAVPRVDALAPGRAGEGRLRRHLPGPRRWAGRSRDALPGKARRLARRAGPGRRARPLRDRRPLVRGRARGLGRRPRPRARLPPQPDVPHLAGAVQRVPGGRRRQALHGPLLPAAAPPPRPADGREGSPRLGQVEPRPRQPREAARRRRRARHRVREADRAREGRLEHRRGALRRPPRERRRLLAPHHPPAVARLAQSLPRRPLRELRPLRGRALQPRPGALPLRRLAAAQPRPAHPARGRRRRDGPREEARGGDGRTLPAQLARRLRPTDHRLARVRPRRVRPLRRGAGRQQPLGQPPQAHPPPGGTAPPACRRSTT